MTIYIINIVLLFYVALFDATPKAWRITGYAQGTTYNITYYAKDSLISKRQIDDILNGIDSSLSLYKPYSLISIFNDSDSGVDVDNHLKVVVSKSLEIFKDTEGTFDITVYPLVQAWGFGTQKVAILPNDKFIQSTLPCVGSDKLFFKNGQLRKTSACVKIDLNGIAQGYSVDILASFIERKRIENYLVELGGEIRVKGKRWPEDRLMQISIEGPPGSWSDRLLPLKIIQLEAGAITTSGTYRNFVQKGRDKLSHLIDPKTGYPIHNEMISVTVIAKDAMTADSYDNALMNMGLDKALIFMKRHDNMEAYFIYHKADGTVADTATHGFYKLMSRN